MEKIIIKNISKEYKKGIRVLKDVSFTINDGEFIVIVGPSGCGKTTLLNIIAGLLKHDIGDIIIDGRNFNNVEPQNRDIAVIFQNYALYPTMNVYDNIAFPLKNRKEKKDQIQRKVTSIAELLELQSYLKCKPNQLSGGQKQRVAIGRALVRNPKFFLMDEPLSNLDAALRSQMRKELKELHKKLCAPIVYVTHDQLEALTLADRVIVMCDGEINQIGTPFEVYKKPRNEFVATFLGTPRMNIFESLSSFISNDTIEVKLYDVVLKLPLTYSNNTISNVDVGIRPEDFIISKSENNAIKCKVLYSEYVGDAFLYYCESLYDSHMIILKSTFIFQEETINLQPKIEHVHLFDSSTKIRIN